MKIHHLNCGTMFPRYPRGTQSISYCLLVETNDGLILVDTGYGVQDYENPTWFTRIFILSLDMPRSLEETAIHQAKELGYARDDVKHIVMTHLHSDHAGGLRIFLMLKSMFMYWNTKLFNPQGDSKNVSMILHNGHTVPNG